MDIKTIRLGLLPLAALLLSACGDSGSGSDKPFACAESGAYACQTGTTEPLYTFQWALNHADSYFKNYPQTFEGGIDLNVEPVHTQGYKGQGVNVLVLDSGADLHNEDLSPNADFSMSWNFVTRTHDPYPSVPGSDNAPHGTVVAGIIAAAQNDKGVMGIAPLANLGAANYIEGQSETAAAYGGAPWSSKAHVFNASYGDDDRVHPYESDLDAGDTAYLRSLKNLRDGKGALFIKAAGNSFEFGTCGQTAPYYDCTNPANDPGTLESNIITVAALNAKGSASSYSSAGSVVWITGMGGEYGDEGTYGEGGGEDGTDGPTIFSTDMSGCVYGYSTTQANTPFKRGQTERNGRPDNANCDYTYMNGTSSATPTISGVVALMLSANPDLTWRDVRDILLASARKVDADYIHRVPVGGDSGKTFGVLMDLATNQPTDQPGGPDDIRDGASAAPMELGWRKNGAGYEYSNWYGFGVPDTEKAVSIALEYKKNPDLSRAGDVLIPEFSPLVYWHENHPPDDEDAEELGNADVISGPFPYKKVTSLGTFRAADLTMDQLQVRLSGENVCLGSLGIAARSPSGTVSLLKLPNDNFKMAGIDQFADYALGSFAFYGEPAQGDWEIFAIAANPDIPIIVTRLIDGKYVDITSPPCPTDNADGFGLLVETRIVAQ